MALSQQIIKGGVFYFQHARVWEPETEFRHLLVGRAVAQEKLKISAVLCM